MLDSGTTGHFLSVNAPILNKRPTNNPVTVVLPNGQTIKSSHDCDIDWPMLPPNARFAHILPGLANHSLISVVQLCDAGYTMKFVDNKCLVNYKNKTILEGKKCPTTNLWFVPLKLTTVLKEFKIKSEATTQHINTIYDIKTQTEITTYLHQCLFSPPKSTLLKAIKNNQLLGIPQLTERTVQKYPPTSTATIKGHLHRTRQNIRSTKNKPAAIPADTTQDMSPTQEINAACELFCFAALADANDKTIYTDLAGKFSVRSYSGQQYIFLAYVYDSNAILVRPMKNREKGSVIEAFKSIYNYLSERNFKPKLHVMDNEISKDIEQYITDQKTKIQFVEPHQHRVNAAERAIQTYKNHLVSGLCTVDPLFPLQLWDELLPQSQDTLLLLRASRTNSKLSAYATLEGEFNFDKTPLAPPGTKALVYVDPKQRATWGTHALDGWYVGPAKQHYRCYKFFIPETKGFRIAQTAKKFPAHTRIPTITRRAQILINAKELTKALLQTNDKNILHPPASTALKALATIFSQAAEKDKENTPTQRVNTSPNNTTVQRVDASLLPTTSQNTTNTNVISNNQISHTRKTRNNTPINICPIVKTLGPSSTARP